MSKDHNFPEGAPPAARASSGARIPLGQIFPDKAKDLGDGEKAPAKKTAVAKMGFERIANVFCVVYYYRSVSVDAVIASEPEVEEWRNFYMAQNSSAENLVHVFDVSIPTKRKGRELLVLVKTHEGLPDGVVVCWSDEEAVARVELAESSLAGWGNSDEDVINRFIVDYPSSVGKKMGFERLNQSNKN